LIVASKHQNTLTEFVQTKQQQIKKEKKKIERGGAL